MQQRARHFQGPSPQTQGSRSLRNRLINLSLLQEQLSPWLPPRRLIPIGFEQPSWGLIGINTPRFACSCSWIGKANLLVSCRSRIMKLKNSTSGILRETDPVMVQRDYVVRPNQPAIVQTRCKWIIGEITEVLDHNTWKLGKIVKMLHNNYFVIRLADCIQLKEFHISSLRVPLQNAPTAPHSKQVHAADKATRRGKQLPADLLRRSGKKRKSTAVLESPQPRQRRSTQPHKVTATADQFLQQHRHHPQSREEETECSVASCSANDDASDHFATGSDERQRCPIGRGDAMSSAARVAPCTTTSGRESDGVLSDGPPAAAAVDVHVLELEAYRSTVRALHASGPLTWEQESLLTNLRLSLNISNEEHLLQLRHLLSS